METSVNFNELEDMATINTASSKVWAIMAKLGIEPYKQTDDNRWYYIPKAWISFKKPGKPRGKPINEILQDRVAEINASNN